MPEMIPGALDLLMNKADKTPFSPEDLALRQGWVGMILKVANL